VGGVEVEGRVEAAGVEVEAQRQAALGGQALDDRVLAGHEVRSLAVHVAQGCDAGGVEAADVVGGEAEQLVVGEVLGVGDRQRHPAPVQHAVEVAVGAAADRAGPGKVVTRVAGLGQGGRVEPHRVAVAGLQVDGGRGEGGVERVFRR